MVHTLSVRSQKLQPFTLLWVSYGRAVVVHIDGCDGASLQQIPCNASVRGITGLEKRTTEQSARLKAYFATLARYATTSSCFAIAGPDASKFELRDYFKQQGASLAGLSFFARCESSSADSLASLAVKMKQYAQPAPIEQEAPRPQEDPDLRALRQRTLKASLRKAGLSARYRYN